MDVSDIKSLHTESKKRMDAVLDHVRRELAGVRTGRASINLLDGVQVEAWGSTLPLNQVASLSVPESTLIVATPFDPSQMGAIEKAIRSANLGLNPANDDSQPCHERGSRGDLMVAAVIAARAWCQLRRYLPMATLLSSS